MFEAHPPFTRRYDSGMHVALGVLYKSQKPGRHEAKQKFSTARKARTVHANIYAASPRAVEGAMVWRSERTRFVATSGPTDTAWFTSFMAGYKARVGERRKQDAAIPIGVMLAKQRILQQEWEEAELQKDAMARRDIAEHAAFYLFLYCGSLRGFEGPKVVLDSLRRQIVAPGSAASRDVPPHVALPLVGRFKARSQEQRNLVIPIAYETESGLRPGLWAERLVQVLEEAGIRRGWAFQDANGVQRNMVHFEERFYELLSQIKQDEPHLFPEEIDVLNDYHLGLSHRRGATTRATAAGVAESDIDWMNRWNIGGETGGSGPMRVLYADRRQLLDAFLRFSRAL